MLELLVILLILGIAVSLPWIGGWSPEILLWGVTVVLFVINLGMTVINLIQARRRIPRFLDAYALGIVQTCVGLALLATFLPTLGPRIESLVITIPYLAGGILVLFARILPARTR